LFKLEESDSGGLLSTYGVEVALEGVLEVGVQMRVRRWRKSVRCLSIFFGVKRVGGCITMQ